MWRLLLNIEVGIVFHAYSTSNKNHPPNKSRCIHSGSLIPSSAFNVHRKFILLKKMTDLMMKIMLVQSNSDKRNIWI